MPNVRAEQAAAAALQELSDDLFVRVVKAEGQRRTRRGRDELINSVSIQPIIASMARRAAAK
jgi:hypothetical protein